MGGWKIPKSYLTDPVDLGLFYKHLCHSLIDKLILLYRILKTLCIPNWKSWWAEVLKECSPPTMCYMSLVTFHVSGRCHISCVRCQVSGVTIIFVIIIFKFIFSAKWWGLSWEGLLSTGPNPSSLINFKPGDEPGSGGPTNLIVFFVYI